MMGHEESRSGLLRSLREPPGHVSLVLWDVDRIPGTEVIYLPTLCASVLVFLQRPQQRTRHMRKTNPFL